jgi:hypothetical protein
MRGPHETKARPAPVARRARHESLALRRARNMSITVEPVSGCVRKSHHPRAIIIVPSVPIG